MLTPKKAFVLSALAITVSIGIIGCATRPPAQPNNICAIFDSKPSWYRAAKKSAKRWGGSVTLPMAIMYQESSYKAKAKPPMQYFLWIIPTGRASDAYGYSQALESTWAQYQKEIGSRFRDRDNFADAYDFIQWYVHKSFVRNGVSKTDAYGHYLNYHEGHGGYARGSYRSKQWLLNVAQRVDRRNRQYERQLLGCQPRLDKRRSWF